MVSVTILPPPGAQARTVEGDNRPLLLRDTGADEGGTLRPDKRGPEMLVREHAGGIAVLPIVHPDRQRPKLDFVKAWRHFSNVLKDKERTDELIGVFDA